MRIPLQIFLSILLLFSCATHAQDQSSLDSLQTEINISNSSSEKIDLLLKAIVEAGELNQWEEAKEMATEALNLARDEKLIKKQVLAMKELVICHHKMNDYTAAFKLASEAIAIAEKNDLYLESAEISQELAQLFLVIGEYDKSVEISFAVLKSLEEHDLLYLHPTSLELIGRNYAILGKDSLSGLYYRQAIRLGKEYNDYSTVGVAMINLSNHYRNIGELHEAIELLKSSCALLEKHNSNTPAIGTGYSNMGVNYIDLQEYDSAFAYLKKSEAFNRRINNNRNDIGTYIAFAYYYHEREEFPLFLEYAQKALLLAEENDFLLEQKNVSWLLERFYVSINNSDSAYKYKSIIHEISQEINDQDALTKLAQLEMMKEMEIAEKDQLLESRRKTFIYIISLVIAFSFLIVLFVLMRQYRTKAMYSKLKEEKLEGEIASKNKEMIIQTMDLTKRNELLSDITKELLSVSENAQKEETKDAIHKIAIDIEKATEGKIWQDFIMRFKEVHADFYKNLITKYPNLTPNEQRLCAFLKLNLSTKEISAMTGQSERTIVMARYRLRKKLGIESSDTNLISFISKI